MHDSDDRLRSLHTEYAELAARPARELTADQRHGLAYYFADVGDPRQESLAVQRWTRFVHDLDAFIERTGRWPAADARRPRPRSVEQALVDQLAYQRRDDVRAGLRAYQVRRLESIPGFSWKPLDDQWRAAFKEHERFWRTRGRAPRRRSSDSAERGIARWVAHQRSLNAAGTLDEHRKAELLASEYRVL